jgi:hypothetical protein
MGVNAVGGNAQVTVNWDIVPGAITYNLWRATTSGGPYILVAGNIGGVNLGYTDNTVTNLTTYYYIVTANGSSPSPYSTEVSATPAAIIASVTAAATNGQIVVSWIGSPGSNYNLKRSFVTGGPYSTIASSLAATNFTDASAAACQNYYYVVTITNAGSESLNSPEANAYVPGPLPSQFTSADIGAVGLPGNATHCNGQFTVSGSGADIWGTNDAFQFVYIYVPSSTNCDIDPRIACRKFRPGACGCGAECRNRVSFPHQHRRFDLCRQRCRTDRAELGSFDTHQYHVLCLLVA